jgi:hypothetical protein
MMIRKEQEEVPVYPLSVITDDYHARDNIRIQQKHFEKAIQHAAASSNTLYPLTRVDMNATTGIVRAAKELMITKIIMGWNGKLTTKDRFFGSVLDNVVENTEQMVWVAKLILTLNTIKKIVMVVPPNAHAEAGFADWVATIKLLCHQTVGTLTLYADKPTLSALMQEIERDKPMVPVEAKDLDGEEDISFLKGEVNAHDLLLVVSARENTVSYHDAPA